MRLTTRLPSHSSVHPVIAAFTRPHRCFARQIDEIRSDWTLRYYGVGLGLTHCLSATYWLVDQPLALILTADTTPICWPFLPACHEWRVLPPVGIDIVLIFILILGALTALLFTHRHTAGLAYTLLAVLTLGKIVIVAQDYRLILNQHYMATWIAVVFLFVPQKRRTLIWLLVAFYVSAGLLKFTPEWASGASLYGRRPLGLPPAVIPLACLYVILLEVFLSPLMALRRRTPSLFVLCQLYLFHLSSFWVVGYFYPILMFLLLSVVGMDLASGISGNNSERRGTGWIGVAAVITIFAGFQAVPRLMPGDSAITGEGRLWALNMFDAPLQCRATANIHTGVVEEAIPLRAPFVNRRIACDPILYYELARHLCRDMGRTYAGTDFDLTLETRLYGKQEYETIVSLPSFCKLDVTYSVWTHNQWIAIPGQRGVGSDR